MNKRAFPPELQRVRHHPKATRGIGHDESPVPRGTAAIELASRRAKPEVRARFQRCVPRNDEVVLISLPNRSGIQPCAFIFFPSISRNLRASNSPAAELL